MNDVHTRICQVAVDGEREHGSDGVVYYDVASGTIGWRKLADMYPDQLRDDVGAMLTEYGNDNFFVCQLDDRRMHVWQLPRMRALEMLTNRSSTV